MPASRHRPDVHLLQFWSPATLDEGEFGMSATTVVLAIAEPTFRVQNGSQSPVTVPSDRCARAPRRSRRSWHLRCCPANLCRVTQIDAWGVVTSQHVSIMVFSTHNVK